MELLVKDLRTNNKKNWWKGWILVVKGTQDACQQPCHTQVLQNGGDTTVEVRTHISKIINRRARADAQDYAYLQVQVSGLQAA